jgi:hypothetical protein
MFCSEMTPAAATPADSPACAPDAADLLLDAQLRTLGELADIGLEIARAIERRVKEAEPAEPLADLNAAAAAYDRVARSVRLCRLLQDRLTENRRKRDEAERFVQFRRRQDHAGRVKRIVGRMAREAGEAPEAIASLVLEASERLDTDDVYGEVATRPVGELVALVCRDLGVEPDWSLWADEAWTQTLPDPLAPERPLPLTGDEPGGAGDLALAPDGRDRGGGGGPPPLPLEPWT